MQRLILGLALAFAGSCAAHAADVPAPLPPSKTTAAETPGSRPAVKLEVPGGPAVKLEIGKDKPQAPPPLPLVWSDAEVAAAKSRCALVLKNVSAVAVPEPAFRSGACGTPAPMRLISIGKNPEVSLSPPPVLTCEMIAALELWMRKDVQPLARKHFGESVIKIETMSDYSCRAAYGRKGNRLSEHGRANALDVRAFVTSKGQMTAVLGEWGKTQRDVRREIAAAKAAAEKAEKIRVQAEAAAAAAKAGNPSATAAPATGSVRPHITINTPAAPSVQDLADRAVGALKGVVKGTVIDGSDPDGSAVGHTLAPPSRLGGPERTAAAPAGPEAQSVQVPIGNKGRFLRAAHAAACRIFGTTLGPEANEAHRNHFHLDMAVRDKLQHFCE